MQESKIFEVKKECLESMQRFISIWAKKNDVQTKLCMKLNVCSDEIVSNVVFYSGAQTLEILCKKEGDEVSITYIDDGKAFNPLTESKEPDISANLENRQIGGLGIFMVKKMMNEVLYERIDEKNILTIKALIG